MTFKTNNFTFLIFQFLVLSSFSVPISGFEAQTYATGTLYLSNFNVSEFFDNKLLIQGANTTGDYVSLVVYPQNSISIEIYEDLIVDTFPGPLPEPPLPFLPPPDPQIDFFIPSVPSNVGLKVSNGSHTIKILDGYDAFGLFATPEMMQLIVDNQTNPDFEYINTTEEFGIKTWHFDINTGPGTDGAAQDNSYQEYYERRYSKQTGLLTYMRFDEGYVHYECCGVEKHYILSSTPIETSSNSGFNGFLLFPLTFTCLFLLKKQVKTP